jgi:hypothetical protein
VLPPLSPLLLAAGAREECREATAPSGSSSARSRSRSYWVMTLLASTLPSAKSAPTGTLSPTVFILSATAADRTSAARSTAKTASFPMALVIAGTRLSFAVSTRSSQPFAAFNVSSFLDMPNKLSTE